MSELAHAYTYRARSVADPATGRVGLQTSGGVTVSGPAAHPRFFTGFIAAAEQAATGLLAVANVAQARYFSPQLTALRDPVVTCGGDRLRFESFSGCCGVYARLDVLSGALDGEVVDRGTTNVDVNGLLREALARVGGGDPLRLTVGPDELAVTTLDGPVVEKKVPLPERWLRGFTEVQIISAGFDLRAELPAVEAVRFLRSLPRPRARSRGSSGPALWAVPAGRSLRLTSRPAPGAVCLPGPERLEALQPLLRFARSLRAFGPVAAAGSPPLASAWELELPEMRLVLTLSPEPRRGFSGEGAALHALADDGTTADADLVGMLLAFEPRVEVGLLVDRAGLPAHRVRAALAQLGTAGRVGYDVTEAAYFHRELPYDPDRVERLNPRLRNARALVAAGAVRFDGELATVTLDDHAQRVRFAPDGTASCTCPWWASYRGSRGPCKHVLAAGIARRDARLASGLPGSVVGGR
jgi:SWIM zinc finger